MSILPKEIMLAILEDIDEPRDLLSLALCNHSFKRIIIPRHLSFRHIRYDAKKASLWKYLVDRPVLAARLRKLEVVDVALTGSRGQLMPSSLPGRKRLPSYTNPTPDMIRDLIYEMLPFLVRLQRFVWIQYGHSDDLCFLENFGEPSMLQEFHLAIWLNDHDKVAASRPLQLNKSMTWNLRSVAIQVSAIGLNQPETRTLESNIQILLSHSPLLEDLCLMFSWLPYLMIEDLLKSCQWPFLQRFSLGHDPLDATPETVSATTLARFFRSHPTLHSVAFLYTVCLQAGSILADVLPRLKSLVLFRWDMALADVLPVEVARRLVNFHGAIHLEGGRSLHVLSQMRNLETCHLTNIIPNGRILGDAIRGFSHLTRFFYETPFSQYSAEQFTSDQEPIPELPALLTLKQLVYLSGPALYRLSLNDPRTTALDLLVKNLPHLLFVQASFSSGPQMLWLKIARTSQEKTTTCHTEAEAQFKFIPTDHHEYPVELNPGPYSFFSGFEAFPTSRYTDFWT